MCVISRKCSADAGRAAVDCAPTARGATTLHVASGEGPGLGSATGEGRASAEMQLIRLAAENVPIHSKQGSRNKGNIYFFCALHHYPT